MKILIQALIILMLFTFISLGSLKDVQAEDATIGIAKTGLFHGQVSIDGLKQMIYYFEKLQNADDPNKEFQNNVSFVLDNAKAAKEAFEIAILFAEESIKPKNKDKSAEKK